MGHISSIETLDHSVDELSKLTVKQREVLDLVLRHKSSKQIARILKISHYTVDQRIASARHKLGVSSRGELARAYSQLLQLCEETACGSSHVAGGDLSPQVSSRDQLPDSVFMLSDATSISMELPWHLQPDPQAGLGAIDNRFGILGRVLIIPAIAVLLTLLALAMVAIAMILPAVF